MPKLPAITEQELVRQCKSGNLKYQELLYKQFYGYAMGIGLRYLSNRDDIALEVVNDAFIKVFNTLKSFDEKLPFKPWLRKVIVNTAIDQRKKNLKNLTSADLDEADFIATPATAVSKLNANDIVTMMQTLPEINRVVFNLYEVDGYSHDEIGLMLNIAVSSSRVYLSRAKERLRKIILLQEEK